MTLSPSMTPGGGDTCQAHLRQSCDFNLGLSPHCPFVTTSDFLVAPIMSVLIFEGAISS